MSEIPHPEQKTGHCVIEMFGVGVGSLRDLEQEVLKNVDWTVHAGEYWVIAGLEGAGKSDFLSMTGGLTPPQAGCYRLFGHEMPIFEGEDLKVRLRIGLVFDGGQLLHHLTVRDNVALPARYHERHHGYQAMEKAVDEMLELTDLVEWTSKTPGTLGRNLQQRVGLARALMLKPEVLLLDNPLGGLDTRQATWWVNFLGQLNAGHPIMDNRPVTVICTAGNFRSWRNRASHFALLQNKKLIVVGSAKTLAGHTEPLVKELLLEGLEEP